MGRTPNDIVNIARKLVYGERIKKCNRTYDNNFRGDDSCVSLYLYSTEHGFCINFRNLYTLQCRKIIVCFKTGKPTTFIVPNNY